MKIKHTKPKVGDTRQVTKFLFLPMTLDNETRWMEVATFTEMCEFDEYESAIMGESSYKWNPVYWGTPRCTHGYENWDDCPDCGH